MTADGFYQHATRTEGDLCYTHGPWLDDCAGCETFPNRVSVPVTEPCERYHGTDFGNTRPVLWALILFGDVIYEIGDDGEYLADTACTIIGYDPEDDTYTLRRLRDNLTFHEPAEYITNGKDWGLDLDHISDLRRQHPDLTP